ncbi:hypothetical protein [Microbulbifer taiwanensis]|uniref:Uncharacterized protein n=1 Tax=Microbulbifer taiwanensis TaxID=986746 RepID=A0ABW1YMD8_9GAMM|nr:hypothetical protein [Microbulbifer taiwanensis]
MENDSVYSHDAVYYLTKGSAQIGIYSRQPYKRIGSICCHRGKFTDEYFLKGGFGDYRLLQAVKSGDGLEELLVSIYSVEGDLLAGPKKSHSVREGLLAVDRERTHFAVLNEKSIEVYDSDLNRVKEHLFSADLIDVESVAISNKVSGALIKDAESLVFIDFRTGEETFIDSCNMPKGTQFRMVSYEATLNKFLMVSQSGSSCVIDENVVQEFEVDVTGKLGSVYATNDVLLVVTSDTVAALDANTFTLNGLFELKTYYENKFGKDPAVRPFFVQNEYDYSSNTMYLSGGGNTGSFFELKPIKQ